MIKSCMDNLYTVGLSSNLATHRTCPDHEAGPKGGQIRGSPTLKDENAPVHLQSISSPSPVHLQSSPSPVLVLITAVES